VNVQEYLHAHLVCGGRPHPYLFWRAPVVGVQTPGADDVTRLHGKTLGLVVLELMIVKLDRLRPQ
jgi:hypothetical protein